MIFALCGKIEYKGERYIVINTGAISFKVFATKTVLDSVTENEPQSKIFTYLHVRETAMELYGFCTKEELDFFELLIGVQGVGPRTAMIILSEAPMNKIKAAIKKVITVPSMIDYYIVSPHGKRHATTYGIKLPKEKIEIIPSGSITHSLFERDSHASNIPSLFEREGKGGLV